MPRVSVVIPAFNASAFVEKAVRSALDQTLREIEVFVVDDGSGDDTVAKVKRLAAKDARLRLIELPQNRGVSAARNAALDQASGEWVATLDADDWYDPDRLARLTAAGEHADIVVDNRYQLYAAQDRAEVFLPEAGPPIWWIAPEDFVARCGAGAPRPLNALCPIYRRSLLESHRLRFDERLRIGEDTDLLFRALDKVPGVVMVRTPGYYRVVRRDSLSFGASLDQQRDFGDAYRRMLAKPWRNPALRKAIEENSRASQRAYRIRTIGRPLKRGQILKGIVAALRDPVGAMLMLRSLVSRTGGAAAGRQGHC